MVILFDKMADWIPEKVCQKYRDDGEFVIVTNFSNKIIYLNSTAGDVFLMCDGKKTVEEICQSITCEYNVTMEILQNDIVKLIRDLQWNRLIKLRRNSK